MELDLFKRFEDISEDVLHPKFKFLRDTLTLEGERKIIKGWTSGFEDRDNKIIKEFQTTFHSSLWEFYLYQVFKKLNFEIDFSKDRPDFIIKKPLEIFIEAVVSNVRVNGRAESTRGADDLASMILPPHLQNDFDTLLKEAIVRNSNAILGKNKKYTEKYINLKWVHKDSPFIIALSSYDQVNYGREYYYPLVALLYGLYYDKEKKNFIKLKFINKPGSDSEIPIGIFNDKQMEHISAIIFSCTTTFGKLTSMSISENNSDLQMNRVVNIRNDFERPFYKFHDVSSKNPEELSDGLFIFHNPNATNKINTDFFSKSNIVQVIFEDRKLAFIGGNMPIVSRLNMNKMFFLDMIIKQADKNFNG